MHQGFCSKTQILKAICMGSDPLKGPAVEAAYLEWFQLNCCEGDESQYGKPTGLWGWYLMLWETLVDPYFPWKAQQSEFFRYRVP